MSKQRELQSAVKNVSTEQLQEILATVEGTPAGMISHLSSYSSLNPYCLPTEGNIQRAAIQNRLYELKSSLRKSRNERKQGLQHLST